MAFFAVFPTPVSCRSRALSPSSLGSPGTTAVVLGHPLSSEPLSLRPISGFARSREFQWTYTKRLAVLQFLATKVLHTDDLFADLASARVYLVVYISLAVVTSARRRHARARRRLADLNFTSSTR